MDRGVSYMLGLYLMSLKSASLKGFRVSAVRGVLRWVGVWARGSCGQGWY